MPRPWSARIRSARVICWLSPYLAARALLAVADQRHEVRRSRRPTATSWRIAARRSGPRPVSMLGAGSGVIEPSSARSYCMKTRFQNSRKRSVSSPGQVVGAAEVDAAVVVELRARPARPDRAGLPEVVATAEVDDPLLGHAHRLPDLDGLHVGAQAELVVAAEHRDPDALGVQPEALRRQLPGERDRPLLEVVAEGEVAEHLEEREMPRGEPDVLDVGRPEALLHRRQALVRGLLLAPEERLERLHPGGREQHGSVVRRRHERGRRDTRGDRAPRRTTGSAHGSRRRSRPLSLAPRKPCRPFWAKSRKLRAAFGARSLCKAVTPFDARA